MTIANFSIYFRIERHYCLVNLVSDRCGDAGVGSRPMRD